MSGTPCHDGRVMELVQRASLGLTALVTEQLACFYYGVISDPFALCMHWVSKPYLRDLLEHLHTQLGDSPGPRLAFLTFRIIFLMSIPISCSKTGRKFYFRPSLLVPSHGSLEASTSCLNYQYINYYHFFPSIDCQPIDLSTQNFKYNRNNFQSYHDN